MCKADKVRLFLGDNPQYNNAKAAYKAFVATKVVETMHYSQFLGVFKKWAVENEIDLVKSVRGAVSTEDNSEIEMKLFPWMKGIRYPVFNQITNCQAVGPKDVGSEIEFAGEPGIVFRVTKFHEKGDQYSPNLPSVTAWCAGMGSRDFYVEAVRKV